MNKHLVVFICGIITMMVVAMTRAGGHGETIDNGASGGVRSAPIGNDSVIPQSCYRCSSPCSNYQCCHGPHPQCCTDGRYCYCCSG